MVRSMQTFPVPFITPRDGRDEFLGFADIMCAVLALSYVMLYEQDVLIA